MDSDRDALENSPAERHGVPDNALKICFETEGERKTGRHLTEVTPELNYTQSGHVFKRPARLNNYI